jgi:crotonobetainyl-CoA:carnitine CoA-transferase CaiB-like acyl-CoA transferase
MLSGPYGTMLLADLGARTIKIEPPGSGEGTRKLLANDPEHSVHGMGAYFLTLARNKQSICIDMKSDEGRKLFTRLAMKADVVVENFSPGVNKRIGIDYETLSAINPRIITCSVSGFGHTGCAADRPAFDMVAQGMGGGMSLTGESEGRPLRAGIPIGDLGGGMFAAIGILAAVNARTLTGYGQHVDISMLDAQVSMLNYMATMYSLSGRSPGRSGNGHFVHVPYDTYRTKTRDLIIAVITDNFWKALVEMLDDPDLALAQYDRQPGRLADRDFINRRFQEHFEKASCEVWLEKLMARRIPCAPVNNIEHALNDPQIRARDMVVRVSHPSGVEVEMPGNPVKLSRFTDETFAPPPLLGQHTDAVLRELLGIKDAEIARLRERQIIARGSMMNEAVTINEVGLRDGLQNHPVRLDVSQKLRLTRELRAAGICNLEVTSFVSPKAVPAMADAAELWAALDHTGGVTYSALVPNKKGYDRARAAGVRAVAVVLSATETLNRRNIGMSIAQAHDECRAVIKMARADGVFVRAYIAAACACPYEGVTPENVVIDLAVDMHNAGADEITLADTIGAGHPKQVQSLFREAVRLIGARRLAAHFHDTRGLGVTLAWVALQEGVRKFDASIGGLGGCPFAPGATGNLATEDLVFLLQQSGYRTGIEFDALVVASDLARDMLGGEVGGRIKPWYRAQQRREAARDLSG